MTLRYIDELTYAYKTYGVRIIWHHTDLDDLYWVALAWPLGADPPYRVCAYGNVMQDGVAQAEVETYLDSLNGSAPVSIEMFGIDNRRNYDRIRRKALDKG